MIAHDPDHAGGGNEGLPSYGLLPEGLAACTAITLRIYCETKEWPLDRAVVDLRFTRGGDDSRIDRVITLEGDPRSEQETRLAGTAERRPVTLTRKPQVEIGTDLRCASSRTS